MRRLTRAAVAGVAAVSGAAVAMQYLGRTWGSTHTERRRGLPGDGIVARPHLQTTHAITIDAPPSDVWPWLVQMGYHRAGWYTYPWVDEYLFQMSNPSADRIVPELQPIEVGDIIPDGPPDTAWYVVDDVQPEQHLVLHSTSHVPPPWKANPHAWVNWTWVYVLEPVAPAKTRLIVRVRGACGPWWLRALFVGGIVPADFVMSRSQLRGIRQRSESRSGRLALAGERVPIESASMAEV